MVDQSNKLNRGINAKQGSCRLNDGFCELITLTPDIVETKKAKEAGEKTIASLREQLPSLARARCFGATVDAYGLGEAKVVMKAIDGEISDLCETDKLKLFHSSEHVRMLIKFKIHNKSCIII